MSRATRALTLCIGLALVIFAGCDPGGLRERPRPNQRPTVEITGGAVEGGRVAYTVEFFWFGSDPDGAIDHFLAAVDDTCLCTIVDSLEDVPVDTTCVFDVQTCLDAGLEPAYDSPDSIWQRVDAFSGSFNFRASNEIPSTSAPFEAEDWHTFYIKAVDDRGATSEADTRFFNAITLAPTVRILAPVGQPPNNAAQVSTFLNIRWLGRDDDSPESGKKPVGYQYKMVPLISVQTTSNEQAIKNLTNLQTRCRYPNVLIPDSLVVPMDGPVGDLGQTGCDRCCEVLEEPTDETYLPWDWYPKEGMPYEPELLRFQNAQGGDFAFAVRAIDIADAVMPDAAFVVADEETRGNVIKIDVNPSVPVNPLITVTERNLLGSQFFVADGDIWRVEVPVNTPLDFEWIASADHYGSRVAGLNFALDIPDPGCEVCQSEDGVGGWIGWGAHEGFGEDIIFSDDQADETHVLYVRARDESFLPEREILAVIVMDVISFEFDRTALLVDDFLAVGFNDCLHDDIVVPMVEEAIDPFLQTAEDLEVFIGHPRGQAACSEISTPAEIKLSELARYKLLFWNIGGLGAGTVAGGVTKHPQFETDTERYLSIYMQAGGTLIAWGKHSAGHMLGDYFPGTAPYIPELPISQDPNFGPGTFVWDILRARTLIDRVARAPGLANGFSCSGVIGMEVTEKGTNLGYPAGAVDPTGYVDLSGTPRTAIWFDSYTGQPDPENPGEFLPGNNPQGTLASALAGPPALRVPGLDTLYTYVSNSWTYEAGGPQNVRDACGVVFLSSMESRPIVVRFEDPNGRQGKYAWALAPFYIFAENHYPELKTIMSKLTEWIFE